MSHNSPTRHILEIGKRGLTMMAMALRWFVVVGFAVVRSKNFKLELCGAYSSRQLAEDLP